MIEIEIRHATERDLPVILSFIRELAEFERLLHEVDATEEQLRRTLFGARPFAEVLLAFLGDEAVGFTVFFHTYSTFIARPGIYVEDLYIVPAARGRGIGRRLLAHLASLARERGCGRLEWSVLDWNEGAVRFYREIGATAMEEWSIYRLQGDSLEELAGELGPK